MLPHRAKENQKLEMCIHYCTLNKITIKNRYSLLRIDVLSDQLQQAIQFFTKLEYQRERCVEDTRQYL